jgi:hypothetical protein
MALVLSACRLGSDEPLFGADQALDLYPDGFVAIPVDQNAQPERAEHGVIKLPTFVPEGRTYVGSAVLGRRRPRWTGCESLMP